MSETPTARRRSLGQALRQLRDEAGMTIERAAGVVGISGAHLSRIERAQTGVRLVVVRGLLHAYQASPEVIQELSEITKAAGQRGWWHEFSLNRPYATLIGFEGTATNIRTYQPLIIPGLLQTEDYARALHRQGPARLVDELIEQRVEVRRQRQLILDGPVAPILLLVLDEAAISRPVGGPAVMREQLLRIVDMAARPTIDVQVIAFAAGAHPGLQGSFVILGFAGGDSDIVYVEGMAGDLYPERRIEWYNDVFSRLQAMALSPVESVEMIRSTAEGYGAR